MILVRKETTPDDIHGMDAAKGILTAIGGKSSHAAVVARGMGRPCIVGAGALRIDEKNKVMTVEAGGKKITVKEGDWISFDGATWRCLPRTGDHCRTRHELGLSGQVHGLGR